MKKKIITIKTFLYISAMVLFISSVSLLQLLDLSKADLYFYCAELLLLVLGIGHLIIMDRFRHPAALLEGRFWITIFIMLASIGVIVIVYSFAELNFQFMVFVIPFIIPYTCYHTYQYFLQMVSNDKKKYEDHPGI